MLLALAGLFCLFPTPAAQAFIEYKIPVDDVVLSPDHSQDSQAAQVAEIVEYTVQQGDTLYGIAERYHINAETLVWANDLESNPDFLHLGQDLIILPVNGVMHVVQPGDTLLAIAGKYKATVDDIRNLPANHLEGEDPVLQVGQRLIVPGGTKPEPAPQPVAPPEGTATAAPAPANAPVGTSQFIWPIQGTVSQGFQPYHRAIDILGHLGQPIAACDSGHVAFAGWSDSGWGNYVVIDHGNGYKTLYAHMSHIDVQAGQAVEKGQTIGEVGDTGRATAMHVHLEIYQNGVQVDPLGFLK